MANESLLVLTQPAYLISDDMTLEEGAEIYRDAVSHGMTQEHVGQLMGLVLAWNNQLS